MLELFTFVKQHFALIDKKHLPSLATRLDTPDQQGSER
jgi:hypothetical protein